LPVNGVERIKSPTTVSELLNVSIDTEPRPRWIFNELKLITD